MCFLIFKIICIYIDNYIYVYVFYGLFLFYAYNCTIQIVKNHYLRIEEAFVAKEDGR